jgi:uncharacterized membrane protein
MTQVLSREVTMQISISLLSRWTTFATTAGLIALGTSSPALADWNICNHTQQTSYVAIAVDNGDGYISMGWIVVPGGGCKTVYGGMPKLRGAFVSGHTLNDTAVWKGDNLFCVGMNDFTFKRENRDAGACEARGGHMDGFIQTNLTGNNFTTNLN